MSFRGRLIALVTGLVAVAVITTAGVLAWNTRQAMLEDARADGTLLAHVLSRSAALARSVPAEVETVIGQQMIAQALLTAHFVDAAERAGLSRDDIIARMRDVVAGSTIDEFWVSDKEGRVYLRNLDVEFTFSPDPKVQPQASAFWGLLTGEKSSVVQKARRREIDNRHFKYTGVGGIDGPRIVQVGFDAQLLRDLSEKIGPKRMVSELLSGRDINAIWVLDKTSQTIAHASVLGSDVNPKPSTDELAAVRSILVSGETLSFLTEDALTVVAPVRGSDGNHVGGTIVRLPTDHLQEVLGTQIMVALVVAGIVIAFGFVMSSLLARHITEPVHQIALAAVSIENRTFEAASLGSVTERRDELGNLARTFSNMAHEVLTREEYLDTQVAERTAELEEKNRELEAARRRIDDELDIAQTMQQSILPTVFPDHEGYSGFANMAPARELGGDFYDFFRLDGHRIGVVIADVSGKGVPAAFFMAVARTTVRSVARRGLPPGDCLAEANTRLCAANPLELFVTVFYGILNAATGEFQYASGGHNPPLLVRADGEVEFLAGTDGMALGVMEDMPYDSKTVTFAMDDTLFLYTDGVTEAFDPQGVEFGEERLVACLQNTQFHSAQAKAVKVLDLVDKFAAGQPQADDITCLVLCYDGAGELASAEPARLEITLRNDLAEIPNLAARIESFGAANGLTDAVVFNLNLALDELITNTVSYGYDDDEAHVIKVALALDGDVVTAEIKDDSRPFDPFTDAPAPDLEANIEDRHIGGLGTHFVKTFMDSVAYDRDGRYNRIVLTKALPPADTEEE